MRNFTLITLLAAASAITALTLWAQGQSQNITINYTAKAPANWPLFIAKEAGYYQKYGINATMAFANHPAGIAMIVSNEAQASNYPMEQAMQAASLDGSLVIMGSAMNRGLFAMMTRNDVKSVKDLKGKRFGISQLGDPPYNFAVSILAKNGLSSRDVQWIPLGTDGGGRVAALVSGRIDATMLPPPIYFKLESQGFKEIANLADYQELYAPMAYVFRKSVIAANPKLPEMIIKADAEGTKRYYEDKAMAVKAYAVYDPQTQADVERLYDHDRKAESYERIPYVLAPAVQYIVEHQADPQVGARLKAYDFHKVIDNSVVERLVREHFFENLFGPSVKAEEDRKAKLAFK